jgi:hypothetical protein
MIAAAIVLALFLTGLWWIAVPVIAAVFTAWSIWTGPTLNRRIPKETDPPRRPWDPPREENPETPVNETDEPR